MAEKSEAKKGGGLLEQALEAYGIEPEFVLASRVEGGAARVVTHGGWRVDFRAGEKPKKLSRVAVTGRKE